MPTVKLGRLYDSSYPLSRGDSPSPGSPGWAEHGPTAYLAALLPLAASVPRACGVGGVAHLRHPAVMAFGKKPVVARSSFRLLGCAPFARASKGAQEGKSPSGWVLKGSQKGNHPFWVA